MYQVKEIFYTLQGEGMNAGRPAVFCRSAGCKIGGLEVPSLENIAVWIWKNLKPGLAALARVEVRRESCRHGCVYAGN